MVMVAPTHIETPGFASVNKNPTGKNIKANSITWLTVCVDVNS